MKKQLLMLALCCVASAMQARKVEYVKQDKDLSFDAMMAQQGLFELREASKNDKADRVQNLIASNIDPQTPYCGKGKDMQSMDMASTPLIEALIFHVREGQPSLSTIKELLRNVAKIEAGYELLKIALNQSQQEGDDEQLERLDNVINLLNSKGIHIQVGNIRAIQKGEARKSKPGMMEMEDEEMVMMQ